MKRLKITLKTYKKELKVHRNYYDKKRKLRYDTLYKGIEYDVNTDVIVYIGDKYVGNDAKLRPQWVGPFKIIQKYSPVLYKVQSIELPDLEYTVHGNKLKNYYHQEQV